MSVRGKRKKWQVSRERERSAPVAKKNDKEKKKYVRNPSVYIEMEDGRVMSGKLYPEVAPNTVNNFIALANSGFYDGTIFHRVVPGFMIQGGCPDGTGRGGAGYTIRGEFSANSHITGLKHEFGVISMDRQEKADTASSQFFICLDDPKKTYPLNGFYASFGRIIEGLDVLAEIGADETDPETERPLEPRVIKKITVDTFGVEYPEPEKINKFREFFRKKERTKPAIVF